MDLAVDVIIINQINRFLYANEFTGIAIFTGRNEVVAKVMFLLEFVILFTGGVCFSACWDTTPRADTPPGAELPPPEQTPTGSRHPQSRQPPVSRHSPGKQTPAFGQ